MCSQKKSDGQQQQQDLVMEGVGEVREGEREGEKSGRTSERESERERVGLGICFPPYFLLFCFHLIPLFYFYYFTIHYDRFRREGMQHVRALYQRSMNCVFVPFKYDASGVAVGVAVVWLSSTAGATDRPFHPFPSFPSPRIIFAGALNAGTGKAEGTLGNCIFSMSKCIVDE